MLAVAAAESRIEVHVVGRHAASADTAGTQLCMSFSSSSSRRSGFGGGLKSCKSSLFVVVLSEGVMLDLLCHQNAQRSSYARLQ